jgi:stage 0 sporulation protein B (sporulation initiation phosphotransferase)
MISETQLIDVLRVARHDWMNQLQLIKANLALNRLDRIDVIIDKIVKEAQSESHLSNLKAPKFASLLILQKNTTNAIILHINVPPLSVDLSDLDDQITANLETLFNALLTSSEAEQSIRVELNLYKKEEAELCLELTFPSNGIEIEVFKGKVASLENGTCDRNGIALTSETEAEWIRFTFVFPIKKAK